MTATRDVSWERVSPGTTRTVELGTYSDAPTSDWTVSAVEGDYFDPVTSSLLDLAVSAQSGNNGATVDLSIKVKSAPVGGTGVLATIVSTQGSLHRYMPVLIGAY